MDLKEVVTRVREIRDDYNAIEIGYSDKNQLQEWRKELSIILFYLADNYEKKLGTNKVYLENMKYPTRQIAYDKLKKQVEEGTITKQSDTSLREAAKGGEEYQKWGKEYSEAYGSWSALREYTKAIQAIIYSIGSHMGLLNQAEKTD